MIKLDSEINNKIGLDIAKNLDIKIKNNLDEKFSNAMAKIYKYEPFYAYMLQAVTISRQDYVKTAGVLFRNGKLQLYYNQMFIDSLTTDGLAVILMHEVGHIIRSHLSLSKKEGEINHDVMNIAMDSTINPTIDDWVYKDNRVFAEFLESPEDLYINGTPAKNHKKGDFVGIGKSRDLDDYTAEELYNYLMKNIPPERFKPGPQCSGPGPKGSKCNGGSGNKDGQGDGNKDGQNQGNSSGDKENGLGKGNMLDNHDVMKDSDGTPDEQNEVIQDAVQNAVKKIGTVPQKIAGIINEILNRKPAIDWKHVLRHFIGTSVVNSRRVSISRVSKRYGSPFFGTRPKYNGDLVVGMDVSGSVDDEEVEDFIAEIDGISKILNIKIPIIQGDTEVEDISMYKKHQRKIIRKADGGTNLQPIVDRALKFKKKNLVLFTDGSIPPLVVKQRTLIVITSKGTMDFEAPNAKKIQINKK